MTIQHSVQEGYFTIVCRKTGKRWTPTGWANPSTTPHLYKDDEVAQRVIDRGKCGQCARICGYEPVIAGVKLSVVDPAAYKSWKQAEKHLLDEENSEGKSIR